MNRIMNFKEALNEKRAVKIIAGINNHNTENVRNVVSSAVQRSEERRVGKEC